MTTTLVSNSPGEGANNTAKMTAAFNSYEDLVVEPGNYYVNGTSYTPLKAGCGRIDSKGSDLYSLGGHPSYTGGCVRFIQQAAGTPIFGIGGTGFQCTMPIELVGTGIGPAIEIYGGDVPASTASGHHDLQKITFHYWETGVDILAGYKNQSGVFTAAESHADNSRLYKCKGFEVENLIRCRNQQALNWTIDTCYMQGLARNGATNPATCTFCDVQRGGCWTIRNPIVEHNKTTILRVRDFSPNQCWFKIENLFYDLMATDDQYLTVFEYDEAGGYEGAWYLDITGWVATVGFKFDKSLLFRVPSTLPRKNWRVRLDGLPVF